MAPDSSSRSGTRPRSLPLLRANLLRKSLTQKPFQTHLVVAIQSTFHPGHTLELFVSELLHLLRLMLLWRGYNALILFIFVAFETCTKKHDHVAEALTVPIHSQTISPQKSRQKWMVYLYLMEFTQ